MAASNQAAELLQEHRGWFKVAGVVLLILGFISVLVPAFTSLVVGQFIGWMFLVSGFVLILHSFQCRAWRGFLLSLFLGVLYVGAGFYLIFEPVWGVVTLTVVLAAFFLVSGAFRIILALQVRGAKNWGWMWVSGLATLLVGILIYGSLPSSAFWAIGLLVGIDFIFAGTALFAMGSGQTKAQS